MPKTGSTALQSFLFKNKENIEKYGWRYPILAWELPDVHGYDSIVTNGNFFYDFIDDFEYGLDTESDDWNKKWNHVLKHLDEKNVILSAEAFSVYETEKFLTGVVKKYNNVKAVIYLRRQDRIAESFYNNRIRDGVFDGTFKDYLDTDEAQKLCNYASKLESISRIIKKENLIVHVYEKQISIEDDFLSILGIEKDQGEWKDCGVQNPSIHGNYYNIRKIFNSLYGLNSDLDKEVRDWEYNDLFMQVASFFGKGEERGYFTTEERREFLDQFVMENKEIARDYLGREDGILFYDDRMDYPLYESSQYSDSDEDMIRIFSAMVCSQNQKIRRCMQDYQYIKSQYDFMRKKVLILTIEQKSKVRKILLFAAGSKCRKLMNIINDIPVAAIADNNPDKSGMIFKNGIKVVDAKEIKNWSEYFIVVTCVKTDEIEDQLQKFKLEKEADYILAREYGL